MNQKDVERIERAAEIFALAAGLVDKCFRYCGRFSTVMKPGWYSSVCDACADETRAYWKDRPGWEEFQDLPQAKRARRLEQLLKGE